MGVTMERSALFAAICALMMTGACGSSASTPGGSGGSGGSGGNGSGGVSGSGGGTGGQSGSGGGSGGSGGIGPSDAGLDDRAPSLDATDSGTDRREVAPLPTGCSTADDCMLVETLPRMGDKLCGHCDLKGTPPPPPGVSPAPFCNNVMPPCRCVQNRCERAQSAAP